MKELEDWGWGFVFRGLMLFLGVAAIYAITATPFLFVGIALGVVCLGLFIVVVARL